MGISQTIPIYNEEIPNSKKQGFSPIYRKKGQKQFRETLDPSISTMRDAINMIKRKFGEKEGLGQIIVEKGLDEDGQQVEKRSIKAQTFGEIYDTAYNLGRSLIKRKLYYQQSLQKMKLIGIFSKNRIEWYIFDWACMLFGLTSVPLYDTLGIENLTYCLNQTEMSTLFVSAKSLKTFLDLKDIGNVKTVISFDPVDESTIQQLKARGLTFLYYSEMVKEGQRLKQIKMEDHPVRKQDCFTFSYTSGTTGPPKGAMFTHRNFVAGITCLFDHSVGHYNDKDRHLSYLPLPHLMERLFSFTIFYAGGVVVLSSGNITKLKEDWFTVKVTILLSVPRIFNRIAETIKNDFEKQTGLTKCIIDNAVDTKMKTAKQTGEFSHCIYDSLAFSKIRESFGGNVRQISTGSAPLNPEVQAFLKTVFGCPLLDGYGQTQNTGISIFGLAIETECATMRQIVCGLQMRLCDIPEMKYTWKDVDENGKPAPRGEIWVRGPMVFKGYYKLPDITRDTVNEEGWLKTGDVARFFPEAMSLKIIDRRKNIFKLQQGEYLAPDRIENKYLLCKFVSEVFLHGDSTQNFAVAFITPNREQFQQLAQSKGIKGSHAELCANAQMRKLVLTAMNEVGRREGLNGFELAKNIYLEPESFMARKILTNTMKLIRYEGRVAYKDQIKRMYEEGELNLKP